MSAKKGKGKQSLQKNKDSLKPHTIPTARQLETDKHLLEPSHRKSKPFNSDRTHSTSHKRASSDLNQPGPSRVTEEPIKSEERTQGASTNRSSNDQRQPGCSGPSQKPTDSIKKSLRSPINGHPGPSGLNPESTDSRRKRKAQNKSTKKPLDNEGRGQQMDRPGSNRGGNRNRNKNWQGGKRKWTQQSRGFGEGRYRPEAGSLWGQSSSVGGASTENGDDEIEIPGFYYDKVKKRHFRILPSANNHNVITKERLQREENELKRQSDLQGATTKKSLRPGKKKTPISNITNLVMKRENNGKGGVNFEKDAIVKRMKFLKPCGKQTIRDRMGGMYENLEHTLLMHTNSQSTKLLGLWSLRGLVVQRIQSMDIEAKARGEDDDMTVNVSPTGTMILQSLSKVTNLCWAPLTPDDTSDRFILYTTMCILGPHPSLALLRKLNPSSIEELCSTEFNLGNKAAWTCAWNTFRQQFSIGSEKNGLLIDAQTRYLWEIHADGSAIISQDFSNQTGNNLYSGTKKGLVCCHDLRSSSTRYVSALHHKSPVCSLKLMKDDNYLIASDFSGKIMRWDLRKRRVLNEFHGHNNQYKSIPLHMDSAESILYSAGQDCYTRVWDVRSTELLISIPPPYPASVDYIPTVCYSPSFGGLPGNMGLLMGMKGELHFYGVGT